jgi:hypothetical protein
LKLCIFCSLLQCVVLSPSQSLNLKALTRTLDETKVSSFQGIVGGETLVVFLHHLRAERAEPFAEGLALGVIFDGRRPRHTRARASLQRPHGIRLRRLCGFCLRRPHGTLLRRPRVPSAVTAWVPSAATSWVPSAATAWGASAATTWVPSLATAWGT